MEIGNTFPQCNPKNDDKNFGMQGETVILQRHEHRAILHTSVLQLDDDSSSGRIISAKQLWK